jgi:hypothetical protein
MHYRVFVGISEGKRPLRRHRRWWEDNIKLDLKEIRLGVMNRAHLAKDNNKWRAPVNTSVLSLSVSPS